jgi:uncharacterized protein (DUF697 family)
MNKKNLPRAIRPGAAGPDANPSEATAPAPPSFRSEATMATETAPSETPPEARRAMAAKRVKRYALWSGAAGVIPVPLIDLAAVGGVQIHMLRRISQIYDVPFSENQGKALIASLAGAMIPVSSGLGAASLMKGIPLFGTLVSAIAMPALSAGATYAIGMVFIQHFASGGTLLDFNAADYREFVKAQKEMWSNQSRK